MNHGEKDSLEIHLTQINILLTNLIIYNRTVTLRTLDQTYMRFDKEWEVFELLQVKIKSSNHWGHWNKIVEIK